MDEKTNLENSFNAIKEGVSKLSGDDETKLIILNAAYDLLMASLTNNNKASLNDNSDALPNSIIR